MNDLKLTNDKLSIEEVMKAVTAQNCGAISLFVGTTRDTFEDKHVLQLEYEAYESMAYKSMQKICLEMRDKWKAIENIAIHHRLGIVPVAESSVIIAISSPHRDDALKATQWCIDSLKKTVPIWKKEIYTDDKSEWKENKECNWSKKIKEFKSNKIPITQLVPVQTSSIPSHLIQITCSTNDLNKRIQTFVDRKREQVNNMNIRDFCGSRNDEGCARTSSMLIKQKNTKSHLKVNRVFNMYGPRSGLTSNDSNNSTKWIPNGSNPVEERLQNLEQKFSISKPVPKDVYVRIKQIEDRLLQLESISPEYAQFWNTNNLFETAEKPSTNKVKRKYSMDEIDKLLFELEAKKLNIVYNK